MDTAALNDCLVFSTEFGYHVFLTDGSRIYDIPHSVYASVKNHGDRVAGMPSEATAYLRRHLGYDETNYIQPGGIEPPPLYSLSLNVVQACNLSCRYCYADEGKFGAATGKMSHRVAMQAVDRLFQSSDPDSDLVVGFMGGEPFLNRNLIADVCEYATSLGQRNRRRVKFSVTTNGTLLSDDDFDLLVRYPFTVTLSVDGQQSEHNLLRPAKNGQNGFVRLLNTIEKFRTRGKPKHLGARVSVTPKSAPLPRVLDYLIQLGFDEVGFSPVLVSPNPGYALSESSMPDFLQQMIECAETAKQHLLNKQPYPFSNFETALHQIHRGTHRPYACGAGAGYMSVSADGGVYACHRLVNDDSYLFGDVTVGFDQQARRAHLQNTHVDRITPCHRCWAKYLCGGGCRHEVTRVGRIGCDYVRGWLRYCLKAYVEISSRQPAYFQYAANNKTGVDA